MILLSERTEYYGDPKEVQHQPEDFLRWETKNYIVQLIPEQKARIREGEKQFLCQ
ncbi:MAG: hypothetical protein SO065_01225 [Lawsonibacter sp.]|nr:hypothetical protein [Lawsonibacter sp.]